LSERYPYAEEGAWHVLRWRAHRFVCCDCGLLHVLDFRVVGKQLQMRAFRDQRATGQLRRWMRWRRRRRRA